jgi:hypothetical protein
MKQATSMRLSIEAKRLLALLASKMSISQTAVVELAIREKAKKERVNAIEQTLPIDRKESSNKKLETQQSPTMALVACWPISLNNQKVGKKKLSNDG